MTRELAISYGELWLDMEADAKGTQTYEFFEVALEVLKAHEATPRTNGEAIQAMFPDCQFIEGYEEMHMMIGRYESVPFSKEFWDAPYREERRSDKRRTRRSD